MSVFKMVGSFLVLSILVAVPSMLYGGIADTINGAASQIPVDNDTLVTILAAVVGIVYSLYRRLSKTEKPASELTDLRDIFKAVSNFFDRLAKLSDKVLPQRTASSDDLIDKKP